MDLNASFTSIWESTVSHMVGVSPMHLPSNCEVACLAVITFVIYVEPCWYWDGWPLLSISSCSQSLTTSQPSLLPPASQHDRHEIRTDQVPVVYCVTGKVTTGQQLYEVDNLRWAHHMHPCIEEFLTFYTLMIGDFLNIDFCPVTTYCLGNCCLSLTFHHNMSRTWIHRGF